MLPSSRTFEQKSKKRLDVTYNFLTCELSEPPQIQWLPKKTGVFLGVSLAQKTSTGMTSIVLNQVWGATGWCQAWRCWFRLGTKKWYVGWKGTSSLKRQHFASGVCFWTCRPFLQASAKRLHARQWAGALSNSDEESTKWTPEPQMSCAQWHGIKVKVDDQSDPGKGDVFSIPSR